jgi:hypothetical protein
LATQPLVLRAMLREAPFPVTTTGAEDVMVEIAPLREGASQAHVEPVQRENDPDVQGLASMRASLPTTEMPFPPTTVAWQFQPAPVHIQALEAGQPVDWRPMVRAEAEPVAVMGPVAETEVTPAEGVAQVHPPAVQRENWPEGQAGALVEIWLPAEMEIPVSGV